MIDLYEINKKHKEVLHIHKQWRTVFGVQNILEGYIKKLEQQKEMELKNKIPKCTLVSDMVMLEADMVLIQ